MSELMFSALLRGRKFLRGTRIGKIIKRVPLSVATYKFLYQCVSPRALVLATIQDNQMYVDPRDLIIARKLLADGVWEPYQTEVFKSSVKKGMVVVDIGAHIGYYTLLAARLVGEQGKVFAFEPAPDNFALLWKNVNANGYTNVTLVQKAVSNRAGIAQLLLSSENPGHHQICNSCADGNFVEVEAITLEEFFEDKDHRFDVIKVDAEGAEMAILQGLARILENNGKLVYFTEFYPEAILSFGHSPEDYLKQLSDYGFTIYLINEEKKKTEQMDIASLMKLSLTENAVNLLCLREK